MASAAAVAVDQARSPIPSDIGEPDGISSAVFPSDAKVPDNLDQNDDEDDDDDDDDDVVRSRPRGAHINGDGAEEETGLDDDLFGDGDDDEEDEDADTRRRTLDDADLDSGDDEGRHDRNGYGEDQDQQYAEHEEAIIDVEVGRLPLPEPSDGELYLTKVPQFLSIDPKAWDVQVYQPPTTDHHSTTAGPQFSPYNTALSTVHWRKSPSNPKVHQSNARILRWSDGSFTLQFASNPTQQFTIEGNPIAPRQQNPKIPTPTSYKPGLKEGHEGYTYLTIPDNQILRVAHKITAGLSILPSAETTDEALTKLQNSLAALAQGKNKTGGGNIELAPVSEDPDLARQKAEVAEREKQRAQKRRDAAEARERDRNGGGGGGRGMGRSRAGGLSIGMLEDEETGGSAASRPRANKPKQNRRQRRNSEYSDDEDFGNKRGNFANDEYDEEDEFIARSDEEEAVVSSDDEDDGIEDVSSRREKRRGGGGGNKRASPDADGDEDAEGEDEVDVVQTARVKRRRVVDDDDE